MDNSERLQKIEESILNWQKELRKYPKSKIARIQIAKLNEEKQKLLNK